MKKPAVWCVLLAELLILLCGCQTAAPAEDSPAPQSVSVSRPQSQPEQSQPEPETRTAVLCINYIGHPILRIVQRGFSDSAQQLGYEWHVVGLARPGLRSRCMPNGCAEWNNTMRTARSAGWATIPAMSF